MEFKELSNWMIVDGYCATRIIVGGKVENVSDRVAFIEKTPRVRIPKNKYCVEFSEGIGGLGQKTDAWVSGEKGSSEYGLDEDSRKWCDQMLILLGWN